jgi:hypothetical protein
MTTLQEAISAARAGDSERAQLLTADVLQRDPDDAQAWYLLSQLVDSDARRAAYLRKTLVLDPSHTRAQAELDELSPDLFDTQPFVVDAAALGAATVVESVPPVEWVAEEPAEVVEAVAPVVEPVEPAVEPVAAPVWEQSPASEAPVEVAYATTAESSVAVETPPSPAAPVIAATTVPAPPAPTAYVKPARRPKRGNRGLALLLGVLVFLTLIVLAFLIYLLFFA